MAAGVVSHHPSVECCDVDERAAVFQLPALRQTVAPDQVQPGSGLFDSDLGTSDLHASSLARPVNADLFPDLAAERAQLVHSRASRDRMIARLEAVDPDGAADEITKDYIEVTVAEALDDLRGPGAGDFFGRIDDEDGRWYVGRRHIEDDRHDPVVVDWRAPIAAPFYRATGIDPLGLEFRRRFTLDDGEIVAYLDEHLDDPDAGGSAAGIPDPVLAEIGAERSGEMREIVATIQGEQDVVIRSDIDQVLIVQGGPGTGKTAVALHRAAFLLFEHRARLARATASSWSVRTEHSSTTSPTCCRRSASAPSDRAPSTICASRGSRSPGPTTTSSPAGRGPPIGWSSSRTGRSPPSGRRSTTSSSRSGSATT